MMTNEGDISKQPKSTLARHWHAVANTFCDKRQKPNSRDCVFDRTFAQNVSDFTIATYERSFKVHKIVLAARSEVRQVSAGRS